MVPSGWHSIMVLAWRVHTAMVRLKLCSGTGEGTSDLVQHGRMRHLDSRKAYAGGLSERRLTSLEVSRA